MTEPILHINEPGKFTESVLEVMGLPIVLRTMTAEEDFPKAGEFYNWNVVSTLHDKAKPIFEELMFTNVLPNSPVACIIIRNQSLTKREAISVDIYYVSENKSTSKIYRITKYSEEEFEFGIVNPEADDFEELPDSMRNLHQALVGGEDVADAVKSVLQAETVR